MAIKNKDGTPFSLQKPNPVMIGQDLWKDTFALHNFAYEEEVLHNFDYTPLTEIPVEEIKVIIKETKPESKPTPKPEKPKPAPRPDQPPVEVTEGSQTFFYCMPAQSSEVMDELYGELRTKLTYGEQFTFEALITFSGDMNLTAWTTTDKVTRQSILYVPKDRRWWKVSGIRNGGDGAYYFDCMPSDIQPSFRTS